MLATILLSICLSIPLLLLLLSDFPRPPRNLHLLEEVPGTVTLLWEHSPDLAEDPESHYIILKRDASTPTWFTAAECVFSNKYTITGLLPGRKYYFRVLAHNSIGDSDPLDSKDPFSIAKDKGRGIWVKEEFILCMCRCVCAFVQMWLSVRVLYMCESVCVCVYVYV